MTSPAFAGGAGNPASPAGAGNLPSPRGAGNPASPSGAGNPATASGGPWDAELYAANTGIHRQYDQELLRGVPLAPDGRVLDLGCGVGDFTARLAELAPAGDVLGVDAEPAMIALARQREALPRLRFAVCRAQELDTVVPAGGRDLVVSVAMLHWVPAGEQPAVLAQVRRALRPGGAFRADFGGHGQIAATRELLDAEAIRHGGSPAPWYFPTVAEYTDVLRRGGFRIEPDGWVRLLRQRRPLPDAASFLGWLGSQALVGYQPRVPAAARPAFRQAAEQRALAQLCRDDGSYDQDYVRLDLLVHPDSGMV